jgi:putative ABC transport system ATP-binding protein
MTATTEMIRLEKIYKRYYEGKQNELQVLNGIDLVVRKGEFVSIVGESGSGKSTIMNILGVLDRPSEGTYYLDGTDIDTYSDKELSRIRGLKIGFVFQTFNLIGRISARRNIEMPMLYAHVNSKDRALRTDELLDMVGMTDRAKHQPNELSGGQKQRIAIARAMANDPAILLADEPTGALDSKTGRLVMDIFHELHEKRGKTVVLITHSKELAEETQRVITLSDGEIIKERPGRNYAKYYGNKQTAVDTDDYDTIDGEAVDYDEDGFETDDSDDYEIEDFPRSKSGSSTTRRGVRA